MKQENVLKIGIIVVAVLATGGVVGFLLTQRAQEAVVEPTVQKTTTPIAQTQVVEKKSLPVKNELLQDAISGIDNKVTLNLPIGWGDLVQPKLNENGQVLDSPYGTKDNLALFMPGNSEAAKMISNYNYGNQSQYNVPPYVVVNYYPAEFSNDDPNDPVRVWNYTAKEKEKNFQPIINVFNQRSVDKLNLSQKYFSKSSAEKDKIMQSAYRSFWWANEWAIYDRVNVRYFENSTASLRGFGYFEVSGQEMPDTIAGYHVVLFNLEKKMTVEFFLPLEGIYSFGLSGIPYDEKLSGKKNDEVYMTEAPKLIQKAYAYLENPENYKDQKLGQFLRETEAMVSSVKIVTQ